jgi:hypothetical protein
LNAAEQSAAFLLGVQASRFTPPRRGLWFRRHAAGATPQARAKARLNAIVRDRGNCFGGCPQDDARQNEQPGNR